MRFSDLVFVPFSYPNHNGAGARSQCLYRPGALIQAGVDRFSSGYYEYWEHHFLLEHERPEHWQQETGWHNWAVSIGRLDPLDVHVRIHDLREWPVKRWNITSHPTHVKDQGDPRLILPKEVSDGRPGEGHARPRVQDRGAGPQPSRPLDGVGDSP